VRGAGMDSVAGGLFAAEACEGILRIPILGRSFTTPEERLRSG